MIDGPTLVAEALDAGLVVEAVYAEPGADPGLLDRAARAGATIRRVQAGVLARATSPVTPQPVAGVAVIPGAPELVHLRGLVLVLVDVADPGNAGTLLRAAEAAGASAVVFSGDVVDPWNPKCVRAAAGSSFRFPPVVVPDPLEACCRLGEAGVTLVATGVARGGDPAPEELDLVGDVAFVLGSEAHGLRAEVAAACPVTVTIPMAGRVESLNVAMAGTLLAFESARQRRVRAAQPGGSPRSS